MTTTQIKSLTDLGTILHHRIFNLLFGANIDVLYIYHFKSFTLECKLIKQYTHFYIIFCIYFPTDKYSRILSIILMKNWYSEPGY